jgi:hypothetical protein
MKILTEDSLNMCNKIYGKYVQYTERVMILFVVEEF